MAVELYLSIDTPYAASTKNPSPAIQAQIQNFSLGVSDAISRTGGSPAPGKTSVSDLSLTLQDGDMTNTLLKSALSGTQHTYYLTLVKSTSGAATPFETYAFQNGILSSFGEAASPSGDLPTDSVSIAYKSFTHTYSASTNAAGSMTAQPSVSYDATTNRVTAAQVSPSIDASTADDAAPAPTDETFTFKTGSVQNIAHVLGSQRGQAALQEIAHDFHSLAAVIAAAHPSSDGGGTVITLPDQNTITLSGLSEKQIRADAAQFRHLLFG